MLQPGSVKGEARLAADLSRLRDHCAALEAHGLAVPARDCADLILQVRGLGTIEAITVVTASFWVWLPVDRVCTRQQQCVVREIIVAACLSLLS